MKVLSYLENEKQMVAYGKMIPQKFVIGGGVETHYGYLQKNKICEGSLIKFYSQPFRPELITELFLLYTSYFLLLKIYLMQFKLNF